MGIQIPFPSVPKTILLPSFVLTLNSPAVTKNNNMNGTKMTQQMSTRDCQKRCLELSGAHQRFVNFVV
jgi:hypothetical protein